MVALRMPRPSLPGLRRREKPWVWWWRREKPPLTEEQQRAADMKAVATWEKLTIYYADGGADVVEVPQDVLVSELDVRARHRPNSIGPWVWGILSGALIGPSFVFGLVGMIAYPFDPWSAVLWGIAFSPIGALVGPFLFTWLILRSRFAPHPGWLGQMTPDGVVPLIARVYSRTPEEGYRSAMESYEVLEARDQEDWISSGGGSTKTIALVGVGLILLGVLWISLMLIVSIGGG